MAVAACFCSVDFFLALVKIVYLEDETAACQRAPSSSHRTVWCGMSAKPEEGTLDCRPH